MTRARSLALLGFLCAVVAATASPAFAQERGIDIERLVPPLNGDGFIGLSGTRTPGPGRYNFGLWTSWSTNPLLIRLGDAERDVVDHRVTTTFQFEIGIGGRLSFGAMMPIVLYQDADAGPLMDGQGEIAASAPGDPRLLLRYRLMGEDSVIDRERHDGGGVAVQASATLPLGDEEAFASEHGVTAELQAMADFHVFGAGAGAMLGFRHRFEPRGLSGARFRDELQFGIGLKLPIPVLRDFGAILEMRGATDFTNSATTVIEGDFALRIQRGDLTLTGGIGSGWTGGVGSPSFRSMLGVTWSPRVRDSDLDGIPDDRDECPYLGEDFDGYQDSDGCLDPDNDNDLIPDPDDQCPNESAEDGRDEDEDGCTDALNDADRDGIADDGDGCPNAAEDRDGFEDEDGCPDPDNDGDGVLDAQDRCPIEAEDRDGFEDTDGCPDLDNDGDSIADTDDACPNAAEDMDGFEDTDGCPDVDNDRDGVVDADDRCTDGAETINGVDDGDGCPDRGGRALWRVVSAGAPAEQLVGTIAFGADHSVAPAAVASVDQLARHLIARWPTRYRVQVSAGAPERATALAAALTERGVAAARIEVVVAPSVRGARVVVVRAPLRDAAAHGAGAGE